MKIELKNEIKPDGSEWFGVYINGSCDKSFSVFPGLSTREEELKKATEYYNKVKEHATKAKTETLLSDVI